MNNYSDLPEGIKNLFSESKCDEIKNAQGSFVEIAQMFGTNINTVKVIQNDVNLSEELRKQIVLKSATLPKKIENYTSLSIEQLKEIISMQDKISQYLKDTEAF
jgi:hypothetical protein